MKKDEFLKKLQIGLTGLPKNSIEDKISFYSEMIDELDPHTRLFIYE